LAVGDKHYYTDSTGARRWFYETLPGTPLTLDTCDECGRAIYAGERRHDDGERARPRPLLCDQHMRDRIWGVDNTPSLG
jgi:hypothetical protein